MKPLESGGSKTRKVSSAPNRPRLECEELVETDPVSGCKIRVTRFRRGILRTETRRYEMPDDMFAAMSELAKYSPRQSLEQLCDGLRHDLESRGLPSDRQPCWIKIGEDWRERTDADSKLDPPYRISLWTKRIEELTEPVSPERFAGKLLFCLTQVLGREGIDEHLWHINQLLSAYTTYQMAGHVNSLAHAGKVARAGRKAGPEVSRKKGDEKRQIVRVHASAYWDKYPAFRGNASSTAVSIAETVNEDLRSNGLLQRGRSGLSVKRIGDYIRE